MFIIKLLIRIICWPIVAFIFLLATALVFYFGAIDYKMTDCSTRDYNNLFRLFTLRGLK